MSCFGEGLVCRCATGDIGILIARAWRPPVSPTPVLAERAWFAGDASCRSVSGWLPGRAAMGVPALLARACAFTRRSCLLGRWLPGLIRDALARVSGPAGAGGWRLGGGGHPTPGWRDGAGARRAAPRHRPPGGGTAVGADARVPRSLADLRPPGPAAGTPPRRSGRLARLWSLGPRRPWLPRRRGPPE